jgi:hypothetical protein
MTAPRRVSKKDIETLTIPQLLKKYSARQIKEAVEKQAIGVRKPGHPKRYQANLVLIWAHVEYRLRHRDHSETGLKQEAYESLAANLREFIADNRPASGTIRRLYSEAVKLFAEKPHMKDQAEEMIRQLEQTRAANIAATIWANVEYRRRHNKNTQQDAFRSLEADLRVHIGDNRPTFETIKRKYSEAVRLFAKEPAMKDYAEKIIRRLERTRAANVVAGLEDLQIPLLIAGKTPDGLLRSAIIG